MADKTIKLEIGTNLLEAINNVCKSSWKGELGENLKGLGIDFNNMIEQDEKQKKAFSGTTYKVNNKIVSEEEFKKAEKSFRKVGGTLITETTTREDNAKKTTD